MAKLLRKRGLHWAFVGGVVLLGCGGPPSPGQMGLAGSGNVVGAMMTDGPTEGPLDREAEAWVSETLANLSLRQAVAQMVIPWIPGGYQSDSDPEFQELLEWVDYGIGGVSISIGVPDAYVSKLNRLQRRASVPLLVTSDFENGGPGMRINHSYAIPSLLSQGGGTSFSPTMSFGAAGDEELAFEYGRITAVEARAVGVHWLFAPVLDVNSNPENPIINTRSFGEDPEAVARMGAAFIRGARSAGALTTAKHFPGHGDTRTDSHIELPVIDADRARLDEVELVPFKRAIEAGVDAVMTAHVAVPRVLGDNRPATMAPEFMTDLLRSEMAFDGILFTDAMRMGAITAGYGVGDAAVVAVEAGTDVLLAPASISTSVEAVVEAVESGRLTRARIDESVRRLLTAKARLGLHQGALVDPVAMVAKVGSEVHSEIADRAASAAITLVRDEDRILPLRPGSSVLSVTYARSDDLLAGRTFNGSLRSYSPGLRTARLSPDSPWSVFDALLTAAAEVDVVIVGAYVSPRAGVGSVSVPAEFRTFVDRISTSVPTVVVSFGNPYLLTAFPDLGSYMVAWGGRERPQTAAARAVAGATVIGGRLPISIPPLHPIGAGVDRAALSEAVAVSEGRIDPLQEAGFLPPDRLEGGAATESGASGGPGRWKEGSIIPLCRDWSPAPSGEPGSGEGRYDPAPGISGADQVCLKDGMVVSPREVEAARVGMSAEGLADLDEFIQEALADSAASGAALAVVRRGQIVRLRGYGRLDWDATAPRATPSSIFDLASLTKVLGTTTAAMILARRGALALDDAVVDYLPWWAEGDARKADVTLRQLLLHQGGLPPFRRFYLEMQGREAYEEAIGSLALEYTPGDSTVYSDIGLMTIGFVVEAVSGKTLDRFLADEVWSPLGMADTQFTPDSTLWHRIATTEVDDTFRGYKVHGVVHDENAYAIGGVVGHAGLFSSARDLAVFGQMLMDRGMAGPCTPDPVSGVPCHRSRFDAVSIFGPGQVDWMTRRADSGSSRAIGWDTPDGRSSAGDYFSAEAFGHTGYTGTSFWADPSLDLFVVLLTNRVNPTRNNTRHIPLRRGVHDRVAQAISDRTVPVRESR